MKSLIIQIGLIASCMMPLFNIPMIIHIFKRKSSEDISLVWLLGVWGCIVLMFPATLISPDIIFKVFGILNLLLFSALTLVAVKYRFK